MRLMPVWPARVAAWACCAIACIASAEGNGSDVFVQLGNAAPVQDVAVSPDGQWLLSGDASGTIVVWDVAGQRELRRLSAPFGVVLNAAFIDAERFVWTSGTFGVGMVNLSDIDGRRIAVGQGVHETGITGLAVDRAGRIYSSDSGGKIVRWLPGLAGVEQSFDAGGALPTVLRTTRDDHLLVGTADGRVVEYALSPSTSNAPVAPLRVWHAGDDAVGDVARHPNGDTAVCFGRLSGTLVTGVKVFNADTSLARDLATGPGRVSSVAYSPDGRWLAAVTDRNLATLASGASFKDHETVSVWRASDGVPAGRHVRDQYAPGAPTLRGRVQFSPDGRRVFVAAWDERPRSFVLGTLDAVEHAFSGHGQALRLLAPLGGDQLVTADWHATAMAGAPQTLDEFVAEFGGAQRWGRDYVEQARPRFSRFLSPSKLYAMTRWDLATGRLDRVELAHRARVIALTPLQDGSVASLSIMFPDFVGMPPVRTDLIREARITAGEPARPAHFGGNPEYADTEPLYPTFLPGAAYRSGVVKLAAVSGDGAVYASVAEIDVDAANKDAGKRVELAAFKRSAPPEAKGHGAWQLISRAALGHVPVSIALSRDGAVVWASGAPPGKPGQGMYDDANAWLIAHATVDGQRLAEFRLSAPAGTIAPLGNGRRAAVTGAPSVVVAEIGRTEVRHLDLPRPEALMRALAVSDDGRDLVAATPNGTYVWDLTTGVFRYAVPADTMASRALAFTPTRLLTGHDDGSVSVRRRADGTLLGRLIRLAGDEWLSITPEGYFAASAAGDRAVNVRVGRRVFGIDQFYDVFYRPDLVQRTLAGADIRPLIRVTLADAARQPPPVVGVTTAAAGPRMRISYEARSAGGGVGEVRVYHNGKLVHRSGEVSAKTAARTPAPPDTAGESVSTKVTRALTRLIVAERVAQRRKPPVRRRAQSLWVDMVPGANTFAVVATNGDGSVASRPRVLDVTDRRAVRPGRIHLVTVGIDTFVPKAEVPELHFAVKDANDLDAQLAEALGGAFPGQPLLRYRLRNEEATAAGVARVVRQLKAAAKPNDIVLWFVASHGMLDASAQYAIVLHDWRGQSGGLMRAEAILEASRSVSALRQIYILDTCHAGGLDSSISGLYDARLSVLARNMGLHLLASASATEEAVDEYQGNGLFTHTLLKGLKGAAVDLNRDDAISVSELAAYASEETTRIARRLRHGQRPLRLHFGDDIVLEKAM